MRSRWWPLLLLSGCVPDLANECAGVGDCPPDRPVCFAGVCTAGAQETEAADAFVFTGFDRDAGAADAFVFTGFDRDGGAADAAPPPPARDAAPPPDTSDCVTERCNPRDDEGGRRGRGRGGDDECDDRRGRGRGDDCDEDPDE